MGEKCSMNERSEKRIRKFGSGRAMAQAVSRRPLTAEDRVRARVNPCGICGGQSDTGTGIFPKSFGFLLSVSFHRDSPYSYHLGDEQ
jgi:hypothetical protein